MKTIHLALALGLVIFGASGCSSKADEDDDDASRARLEKKCGTMCEHLIAAPLSGCGKSAAASQGDCTAECYDHVTPKDGDEPEATEAELECATTAADCDAWNACGDFL